ncbi:unnamed protein product, partial [Hymenolepis diminuta]
MSLGSAKMRTEFENWARKEGLNNRKINVTNANISSSNAGHVSQHKLAQILGRNEQAQFTHVKAQTSKPPQRSIFQNIQEVDYENGILNSFDNSSLTNEIIKEALDKLIELNKDKLTD